ncbi:hypothetical protein DER46DRAFT_586075 [Fusarium sp. MPI-SDFR-AT-0072]|nr:hypothetical protein DER46DRAFT_586075 [Fusarium sp. MPI-SDFR-AT-0072]
MRSVPSCTCQGPGYRYNLTEKAGMMVTSALLTLGPVVRLGIICGSTITTTFPPFQLLQLSPILVLYLFFSSLVETQMEEF